jgi:hypothetical protein
MYSHRIVLLLLSMCWLFLPAVFEWWLSLEHSFILTFAVWAVGIGFSFLSDMKQERS